MHRFHTEAAIAARLDHPHIVPIYEFGTHEGAHFLAMKYLEGGTLLNRIRQESLSPTEIGPLIQVIATTIHYAHEHGILHRDLKPSNILLDVEGRPYIADFGLARISDMDEEGLTVSHDIIGTLAYMAPEVAAHGAIRATTVSDIYGVGSHSL